MCLIIRHFGKNPMRFLLTTEGCHAYNVNAVRSCAKITSVFIVREQLHCEQDAV